MTRTHKAKGLSQSAAARIWLVQSTGPRLTASLSLPASEEDNNKMGTPVANVVASQTLEVLSGRYRGEHVWPSQ